MQARVEICSLAEVPEKGAMGRTMSNGGKTRHLILIRHRSGVRVYLNSCPHTGVRLDWREDDFMDLSGVYLQCAMHAAMFVTETGNCVAGPCAGGRLVVVPSHVDHGTVFASRWQDLPDTALAD